MTTLYFESVELSTKVWRLSEVAPDSANEATSIVNGKVSSGNYFAYVPGIANGATYGASFIEGDADGAHGWRSENIYNKTFPSGNWAIAYKLRNKDANAHEGTINVRVYRTSYANPTTAQLTKMNSADGVSATISFAATAGEIKTGTVTVNCNQNLTLTDEYIFIILNWKVTTAGKKATVGSIMVVNEGVAERVETPWEPPVSDIDVGSISIDRATYYSSGGTRVDKANPANASGIIHSIKVYPYVNMTYLIVGTFYVVSGDTLKCRDSELIGDVVAGAERTFTELSIAVQEGDYIGCYYAVGAIEMDTSGGTGVWVVLGEHIDPGDEATYTWVVGYAISLYGYGDIEVGAEWKQLQYASEPPTPYAWNQLKREAGTGWRKLLYAGE